MKLQVWNHHAHVGTLSLNDAGRWQFVYDEEWTGFALSPHLPVGADVHDLVHQRTVEWFFDNLLPEGVLREKLASRESLREDDAWGLLSRYGQDTAGALSVLRNGVVPVGQDSYKPLSISQLARMIAQAKNGTPLMMQGSVLHMSLAGAQEKVALFYESGNFAMPERTAPSTHILKPDNLNPQFTFCPANEWFCMALADRAGLKVPAVDLLNIGEHRAYVVQRFDRTTDSDGVTRRLHQIDLCQAINVPSRMKYEDEGGLASRDLFSVTAQCRVPAVANSAAIQWLAFNYLIGNGDAHAKNVSFLMRGQKMDVAPAYDLLCVDAYVLNPRHLTMSIGGVSAAGQVDGCHWDALALENGLDPRAIRSILIRLADRTARIRDEILASSKLLPDERDWLQAHVMPVIAERLSFVNEAMAQPVCNAKTIHEKRGIVADEILHAISRRGRAGGGTVRTAVFRSTQKLRMR